MTKNGAYAPEYEYSAAPGWLWNFVDSLLAAAFDPGNAHAHLLALKHPIPVGRHRAGSHLGPDSRYFVFASTNTGKPALVKRLV